MVEHSGGGVCVCVCKGAGITVLGERQGATQEGKVFPTERQGIELLRCANPYVLPFPSDGTQTHLAERLGS